MLTRDDIIDLADKAGLETCRGDGWPDERLIPKLNRFSALVAERDTALLRQALTVFRMLEDTPCGDKATMEAALRERLGEKT